MKNAVKTINLKEFLVLLALCIFHSADVSSKDPDKSKMLTSQPEGATVYNDKGDKLGQTPFDLSKLPGTAISLKIFKSGYDTLFVGFPKKPGNGYSFPGSASYCEPCVFASLSESPENKGLWSGVVRLRKKMPEQNSAITLFIDTPKVAIPAKTMIGKLNGSSKSIGDNDLHMVMGYAQNLNVRMLNKIRDAHVLSYAISNWKDEPTTMYLPKIILRPVVQEIQFNLKGKVIREYNGPVNFTCAWGVYLISDSSRRLASIPITTNFYRAGNNFEMLLHQMISESQRDLMEIDTLYDYLKTIQSQYLDRKVYDALKVKSAKQQTYPSSKEMLKTATASVVTIESDDGFGSGVFISPEGYILTNHHVVAGKKNISIRLSADKKEVAEIVRLSGDYDLALIKLASGSTSSLRPGKSRDLEVGEEVYAIGTPMDKKLGQSITKGIVSGFREWNGVNLIQTDVSINSGNSGGPLINMKGEIEGIVTMKMAGKGIEGLSFCIPIDDALRALQLKLE